MARILIPTPLRRFTDGRAEVAADGITAGAVLHDLVAERPLLRDQLFDADRRLRSFVNIFINGDDIRLHDDLATPVSAADRLEILPAIAGGEAVQSFTSWRAALQREIAAIAPSDVGDLVASEAVAILDVRTAQEWSDGHLVGAAHVDRGFLEQRIEALVPDRNTPVICYCQSGVRSLFAAQALTILGYARVFSLSGGLQRWKDEGRRIVMPVVLADADRRRYLRHLAIPEVGEAGQQKLLDARVLMIGAGGLGCPAALYLAAAGVGKLGIVDNDFVDVSNLQRQILHRDDRVGQLKTESARETLLALNPRLSIELFSQRLTADCVDTIFAGYDLIVDGSDNFTTRYLVNDAAVRRGVPVVHGSVYRFEGQVGVFWAAQGPCYRCLYPSAPPPDLAPSCADGGVLGVVPGVIGVLQATEVLKLLLQIGTPLLGRALRYDALDGTMRELRFRKDPACEVCGTVHPGSPR